MKLLFLLLLNIPFLLYAQVDLKGIVLDSISSNPIPYATVFINGTTKGSVTNSQGAFEISAVSFPAQVIISHASYSSRMVYLDSLLPKNFTVMLMAKNVELPPVLVADKSLRAKNLKEFERLFLGTDHWGRNASLENEEVLFFEKVKGQSLKVTATAPLLIEMPLLGYTLQVDLVDFNVKYTSDGYQSNVLGYYYFRPYDEMSKSESKKVSRNRRKVYYNSSQHFCRSLYYGELEENGYKVARRISDGSKDKFVNLDTYIKPAKEDGKLVVGLTDQRLTVLFHHKSNGQPVDMTQKRSIFAKLFQSTQQSNVYFLSDTCSIRADGTS